MSEVEETPLPGVGTRYEFQTRGGDRLCVVAHHSGRREMAFFDGDEDDPRCVAALEKEDLPVLAEVLGAAHIVEHLSNLRETVRGLTIDWLRLTGSPPERPTDVAELFRRLPAGITVAAVLRGGETEPAPTREYELESGDTAVIVGPPEAVRAAATALTAN